MPVKIYSLWNLLSTCDCYFFYFRCPIVTNKNFSHIFGIRWRGKMFYGINWYYRDYIWPVYSNNCVPSADTLACLGQHTRRAYSCTSVELDDQNEAWNWLEMMQQENPLVTKLETNVKEFEAGVKRSRPCFIFKNPNNQFFCKHPRKRPLKEPLYRASPERHSEISFVIHLATVIKYRASQAFYINDVKNPNNNYMN